MKMKRILNKIVGVILLVLMVIFIYPLVVMIFGSFKDAVELSTNPAGFPSKLNFDNYLRLVKYANGMFFRSCLNSLGVSTIYTVLSILIAAMAAYAFSKFDFKGKNLLFAIIIGTIMVPTELKMPALYIMFSKMGILDTYIVQILPTLASVFTMFLIRQHMNGLPDALLEAGKIDGAGHIKIFTAIVLPLVKPALGAMAILQFLGKWNDFLWPSMMVTSVKKMPVMVILPTLNDTLDVYTKPMELIMAGCVCVTVPLFIVFISNHDKFMSSVSMGAVKG